jgi:hypothetical protein
MQVTRNVSITGSTFYQNATAYIKRLHRFGKSRCSRPAMSTSPLIDMVLLPRERNIPPPSSRMGFPLRDRYSFA